MIVPHDHAITRTKTSVFVLRHGGPAPVIELDAETPSVTRCVPRVVFLGGIADRRAADDTGGGGRRTTIAVPELVADEPTNDGAEYRAAA